MEELSVAMNRQALRNQETNDNYIDGTLEYYKNPFSKTPQQPKIPDGKMNTSIGYQNFYTKEVKFDNQGDNTISNNLDSAYIVLAPGLMGPIFYSHPVQGGTEENPTLNYTNNLNILLDLSQCKYNTLLNGAVDNPMTWRVVSQALKLFCLEADVNTEGYFESVSLPTNALNRYLTLHQAPDDSGGNVYVPKLNAAFYNAMEDSIQTWRDSKTYLCGNIRDLHEIEFRQVVNDSDHSPIQLDDAYNFPVAGATNQLKNAEFAKAVLDLQFQTRLVRLKFKRGSRFLINSVSNLEFQFPFNGRIKAFETLNNAEVNMAIQNGYVENRELVQGARIGGDTVISVSPSPAKRQRRNGPTRAGQKRSDTTM